MTLTSGLKSMTASRERALASYRLLAAGYGESCQRSWDVRVSAIEQLMLRDGQTVFDVACGTGETLVELAKGVGPSGRIVGIEQCPEMATLARNRIEAAGLVDRVRLIVAPVEEAPLDESADAVLFCYTHDVLQTPEALANLFAHVRPGARVSVTGVRLQPWLWGWPLNLVTLYRTRRYLTTFRGLSRPWESLREYCPDIEIVRALHLGPGYLAAGRFGR